MPILSPASWVACAAVFGLLVGSFLNVVILRLPRRMEAQWRQEAQRCLDLAVDPELPPGIVLKPSHCPHCNHRLGVLDNIPVFSWLALRGRCRYCQARISVQYPLVELAAAVMAAASVACLGANLQGACGVALSLALLTLAVIDLRTQLLPDVITLPLLWGGLLLSLLPAGPSPAEAILGAAIGYLSLWSVYWLFKLLTGKEGMGHGDFKLLAALGAWMGPSALLPIILLSSLVGAVVGLGLIALRRHQQGIPMAFGPFLAAAGWLWLLCGSPLDHLYMQLLGP
ncbi:prepilin peptidase [Frateuria aurantia]